MRSSFRGTFLGLAITFNLISLTSSYAQNTPAMDLLKADAKMSSTLKKIKEANKVLEVHLKSGKSFKGKAFEVGDNFIVLESLAQKEFFSALISIEEIVAIEIQTR